MSDAENDTSDSAASLGEDIKANICDFVDALVSKNDEQCESDFVHLLTRVGELVERKRRLEGTKTDTRDFLGELLFTRLRRGMHLFLKCEDGVSHERAAEWVMGVLFSVTTLTDFARAFDKVLLASGTGEKDFSFAGRTDFISVEEVMQMLSTGRRIGCLSLEKDDNRLDMYLMDGRMFFLDPHHLVRRVLPGSDSMKHREITEMQVIDAEASRKKTGMPVILHLYEQGVIQEAELFDVMRQLGKEVLFDFMRSSEPYAFYYRSLDVLPDFALDHDMRLGVTAILLEGSKQIDDWQQMLSVFPDPEVAIKLREDMFARMGGVALGVLEIKLLSQINGDTTPLALVSMLGLPLFDIYMLLIKLSKDGVIATPGGGEAIEAMELSVEDSMQEAFAALNANDDDYQRQSALDAVLGGDDQTDGPGLDFDDAAASALNALLGGSEGEIASGSESEESGELEHDLLSMLGRNKRD